MESTKVTGRVPRTHRLPCPVRTPAGLPHQPAGLEQQAAQLNRLSKALNGLGTIFSGVAAGTIGDRFSLATLNVSASEFRYGDSAETAAEGAMRDLVAARGDAWSGQVYPLPCGQPAAVVTGARIYERPAVNPPTVPFHELQAIVPVPDDPANPQQALLNITFSTPAATDWDTYMPLVADLLRSLAFTTEAETDDQ
ncbi:hypothetical protein [Streptomyces triticirhizae]|nr:hypothetical protein [Streptomyces triticirhizae]